MKPLFQRWLEWKYKAEWLLWVKDIGISDVWDESLIGVNLINKEMGNYYGKRLVLNCKARMSNFVGFNTILKRHKDFFCS